MLLISLGLLLINRYPPKLICSCFIGGSQQWHAEIGEGAFTNETTKLWSTPQERNQVLLS